METLTPDNSSPPLCCEGRKGISWWLQGMWAKGMLGDSEAHSHTRGNIQVEGERVMVREKGGDQQSISGGSPAYMEGWPWTGVDALHPLRNEGRAVGPDTGSLAELGGGGRRHEVVLTNYFLFSQ